MKKFQLLALCGWLCVASATCAQTGAAPIGEHAGFVKRVDGEVRLRDGNGIWKPARAGDSVWSTSSIATEADSGASVVLRDGTILVAGPSSRWGLTHFRFDATTQEGGLLVSVLRGSLRMISGLIGKLHPEAVRIETETATIGIRGTDFIVQSDDVQ